MGVDRPPNDIHGEIYIVDDDPMVRDALSEVFAQAGFRAVGFVDGASFLAAARERVPACIILDVYMPGRSGLEVLQELDAANYPAPIFIASGRGDIPTAVEAIKNGAFDFFEKREDAGSLVGRVRDAIAARAQPRRNGKSTDLQPRFPGCDLLTPRRWRGVGRKLAARRPRRLRKVFRRAGLKSRRASLAPDVGYFT